MCHVYGRDDTTKIADHQQNVEQRHKNLATDFTKRRNEIQAMQNSFTSFDNSVERFFEWLFDVESTVEQLEGDVEASPKTKKVLRQKFEDIKVIINATFWAFIDMLSNLAHRGRSCRTHPKFFRFLIIVSIKLLGIWFIC